MENKDKIEFRKKLHKGYLRNKGAKWIKGDLSPEASEARMNFIELKRLIKKENGK